ncbi:MAG: hypothetical protein EBT07_01530 [Actinobacteria bacterium]|jgi:hypothetical protein|nr:hypothetical protein [Actinomycetota bacterium]
MSTKFDGRYDRTKPWQNTPDNKGRVLPDPADPVLPRWQYNGPWSSNMERLTQQALMVATIPGTELAQMVRPPLPQIALFPPRYGYSSTQPGIEDIVTIDRNYTEPRVSWFSGGVAGYQAAERNALGST